MRVVKIKAPRKLNQPHHDTFDRLASAVKEIQHKNASKLSFEEHYRYAYTLVLHKQGQLLYDGIKSLVEEHLEVEAQTRIGPAFPSALGLDEGGPMDQQVKSS
jgi:cullin 3